MRNCAGSPAEAVRNFRKRDKISVSKLNLPVRDLNYKRITKEKRLSIMSDKHKRKNMVIIDSHNCYDFSINNSYNSVCNIGDEYHITVNSRYDINRKNITTNVGLGDSVISSILSSLKNILR